jgi:gas vesicle protein
MRGIILAGLAGYLLGLLFAPKKGSELREDLAMAACSLANNGPELFCDAQEKGRDILNRAQPAFSHVKESARIIHEHATSAFGEAMARGEASVMRDAPSADAL